MKDQRRSHGRVGLVRWTCFVVFVLTWGGFAIGSVTYRTVVMSGEQAPDTPASTLFGDSFPNSAFGSVHLNEQGEIAFIGSLVNGSGGVNRDNWVGVWSNVGGQMRLVARAGDQAPGVPADAAFGTFFRGLRFNDAGQTAFVNFLKTGAGGVNVDNRDGIWAQRAGGLELIARSGDPAPGTPDGAVFESFSTVGPSLNNSGQVAFNAILRPFQAGVTFDNWEGVWFDDGLELSLAARQQDPAPGLPAGVVYQEPAFRLGESGRVLIFSALNSGGVQDRGTWLYEAGASELISLESDPVPGEPPTTTYWGLGTSFANAGQLTRTAVVRRDGIIDHSVWLVTPTGLAPLIQDGAAAPGMPDGTVFDLKTGSVSQLRVRNTDLIAFEATYSPAVIGSNKGIWVGDPDALSLVALGAGHPPGTPEGTVFLSFDNLSLNDAGQVAFRAELALALGGVDSSNNRGIWATDTLGQLVLIARMGDLFEVAPGDLRVIDGIGGTAINNAGTLALTLSFQDGTSGIFTATVPEPGVGVVVLAGLMLMGGARKHR